MYFLLEADIFAVVSPANILTVVVLFSKVALKWTVYYSLKLVSVITSDLGSFVFI